MIRNPNFEKFERWYEKSPNTPNKKDSKYRPYEHRFEDWIECFLNDKGYTSVHHSEYDRVRCVLPNHLFGFIKSSQPEKLDKLVEQYGELTEQKILNRISSEISKKGLITVLRDGISDRGVYLDLVYFQPKSGLNPEHHHLYRTNEFQVVRQLHYSSVNENSIDMVLFLNGIPLLTMELKNQLTGQNIKHSENQYRYDRNPLNEPLLQFKRCLVHFCVDNDRVSMTTKLNGKDTFFLPYNKGIQNPTVPNDYRSEYLWNEVLTPDSLLDIIENFVVEVEDSEYFYNPKKGGIDTVKKPKLVFPRYHQLEVIRNLQYSIRNEGVGNNYLIQHTTGSGKSYSIGWLSHSLTSLYRHPSDTKRMFDTVIVITDRKVLDKQLQRTIKSLERTRGVVNPVDLNSQQLKELIEGGKDIIITTIQKFPYISETISKLGKRTFGVVIDEVHSSQSGETSKEMKKTLSNLGIEVDDDGDFDYEDYIREEIRYRGKQSHISFFGFTGTPKQKTLEVFGRKDEDGVFHPFHLYSMYQSISEGFTLDVLKNYTTYQRFFKLKMEGGEDIEIPEGKGKKELIRFVDSHELTIRQKVGIMLEHFINKGSKGILGKGRGMIVVKSRKDCVRYFKEVNKQLEERGITYRTLVGFSGEVNLDGLSYTETSLNKEIGHNGDIPLGLKNPNYRLLIVSNKFQTGFDEPLVQSMYVDKKLGGVQCVQTLSRLNRTTKDKTETFVLDFVNEIENVVSDFQLYFTSTVLMGETDPNKLYDYKDKLDGFYLYSQSDINGFCEVFYDMRRGDGELHPFLDVVVDNWKGIEEEEKREEFRSTLQSYIRLYGYISQIISFEDVELEKLFIFLKYVNKKLPKREGERVPKEVMEMVELDSLRIQKVWEGNSELVPFPPGVVEPFSSETGMSKEEEKDLLSELIKVINENNGKGLTEEHKVVIERWNGKLNRDEETREVLKGDNSLSNKKDYFKKKLELYSLESLNNEFDIYRTLMDDPKVKELIINQLFYGMLNQLNQKGMGG
jgi:type I restriction enzyme R subunit